MRKPRKGIVYCDPGWFPFTYGYCPSREAWERTMKRFECETTPYPTSDGHCYEFVSKSNGAITILVTIGDGLKDYPDPLYIAGCLVHEATHVWQFLRRKIGEKAPGDEMEAYAIEAISKELIKAYAACHDLPGISKHDGPAEA